MTGIKRLGESGVDGREVERPAVEKRNDEDEVETTFSFCWRTGVLLTCMKESRSSKRLFRALEWREEVEEGKSRKKTRRHKGRMVRKSWKSVKPT